MVIADRTLSRARAFGLCALAFASACASAPAPSLSPQLQRAPHYWLSADTSTSFAPFVAHLQVVAAAVDSSFEIAIDTGVVRVATGDMDNLTMDGLYITAIVAMPADAPMRGTASVDQPPSDGPRSWRAIAMSDSVLLADRVNYGADVPIRRLRFRVSLGGERLNVHSWIMFRLSSGEVTTVTMLRSGDTRVRVILARTSAYVCGDHDVFGMPSAERAAALAFSYRQSC